MAYRPYFKHGIEQIQALVASSRGDLEVLKVIQYELGFRDRPKARALKVEVDDLIRQLSAGAVALPIKPHQPKRESKPDSSKSQPPAAALDRLVVECPECKTPNFVSTLEGVVQHLSCSACKLPYEAQFKYGVMRTTFRITNTAASGASAMRWGFIALAVLILVIITTK